MNAITYLVILFLSLGAFATDEVWQDEANELAFQQKVRGSHPWSEKVELKEISREEVLSRAYAALEFDFYYKRENYTQSGMANRCEPTEEDNWLRPYRLNEKAESVVRGIPYKWGGYFGELPVFNRYLDQNRLVGDICTCRSDDHNYCLVEEAVGLDCSGFVSYAWKIPYHTTSAMHKVTKKIEWSELRAGDVLNRAGQHVMIFRGYHYDGKSIISIESKKTCDGVCELIHDIQELKEEGFVPLRYVKIQEG